MEMRADTICRVEMRLGLERGLSISHSEWRQSPRCPHGTALPNDHMAASES